MDNPPDYGTVLFPGVEQVFYEITDFKLLSLITVPNPVKKFPGNRLIAGVEGFSFFGMQLLPQHQKLFFPNHLQREIQIAQEALIVTGQHHLPLLHASFVPVIRLCEVKMQSRIGIAVKDHIIIKLCLVFFRFRKKGREKNAVQFIRQRQTDCIILSGIFINDDRSIA